MKLMYITNDPVLAKIAESANVDWIFIDLEMLGKEERQGHLDTVISRHKIGDIPKVKSVLNKSELLVRVNPINIESKDEINKVLDYGADIIMLPFFKQSSEVKEFIQLVNGRSKTCLLLETPEAVDDLDNILKIEGIDYIHIGLNDLHLGYGLKFMFELLSNGCVERIIGKIGKTNITYGFGGIAQIGKGDLPAETIIKEHIRLKSEMAILSRSFYKKNDNDSPDTIQRIFVKGVAQVRESIESAKQMSIYDLMQNKNEIDHKIRKILKKMGAK